jgi:hypothetical protein
MTAEQFKAMSLKRAKVITDVRVSNVVVTCEGLVKLEDNLVCVQTAKGPVFFDVKSIVMVIKL